MVFPLWPGHLAEWAWEGSAGEADWGRHGGSGDRGSGWICRPSAQHGTQQNSHSHTEMASRDGLGNCKTHSLKILQTPCLKPSQMNKLRGKGVHLIETQPQHWSFTPSANQTDSPRPLEVGILHLPQGLISSWLKKAKKKRRGGGKGERQGWEDEFVEVEWHPGKGQVDGKKHKSRAYLKTN